MTLKKKTVAMVFAVFFLSAVMNYAVQQFVIMPSFYGLEHETAMDNMDRVLQSLNQELNVLATTASDWAYWDDIYSYAEGENPGFVKATLSGNTLENVKINLLNVYNQEGNLLWGRASDLQSGKALDFGDISAPKLPAKHLLRNLPELTSVVYGFFSTSSGPLMLVAKNILTSECKGPVHGTFVVGRFLDSAAIQRISDQVKLQLSITVLPADGAVADWVPAKDQAVPHSRILLKENPDVLIASTVLADIYGHPFLSVNVTTPRAISSRGKSAVFFAIITIGIVGLLVMALLLFILERTILTPLTQLTTHSVQLGKTDDLLSRLAFNRKDEIGVLANAFDQMIGHLAEARRNQVDQSFHAGIAEMASGVLHNIGNAMTPLQTQLVALNDELRAAPVAEMKMAVLELSDASTAPDRRIDLARFVELAGNELAEVVSRSLNHVAYTTRQMQYIQQILTDQQHYSRAARVLEPLNMEAIVHDSVQTLSAPLRTAMTIEVAPSVGLIGLVVASRAALQQVVSNVLVNAAEAILETGITSGRVLVSAVSEVMDGTPMAHFCFEDNGTGIKEENFAHIFERHFSTKERNSGLGLHWSANTVIALNGILYAGNNEDSRGACLHILLPLAEE